MHKASNKHLVLSEILVVHVCVVLTNISSREAARAEAPQLHLYVSHTLNIAEHCLLTTSIIISISDTMPPVNIHLIALKPYQSIQKYLEAVRTKSSILLASRCIRWIIRPEKIDTSELLDTKWDILIVAPKSSPLAEEHLSQKWVILQTDLSEVQYSLTSFRCLSNTLSQQESQAAW